MPEISFRVYGDPKPQLRPRAFVRQTADGPVARVYTPGTAEEWKSLVAGAAMPHLPPDPINSPIDLQLAFYFERPQRLQRKRDPEGRIPSVGPRNDCDNIAKAVMDCLTQVRLWVDDGLVWRLVVTKQWVEKFGGRPGLDFWMSWDEDEAAQRFAPPRRARVEAAEARPF